jgi:hypothetical protein
MTSIMAKFRCWSALSVRETVFSDIGAQPRDTDALFMAAHTPMELDHPLGGEVRGDGSGEHQVLGALRSSFGDPHRNTLIAVTGGSGAGKSHVVRWMHANLREPDPGFHVLYVPRAVQTIRQLLKRIVEGLPGEGGAEIMERVDAAVSGITPVALRDRLLEEIRLALTWNLEPVPPKDGESANEAEAREIRTNLLGHRDEEGGKRRYGLADLLAVRQFNEALLRGGGQLDRFVASVYEATSSRDELQEGFAEKDLPLRTPGVVKALRADNELAQLWNVIQHDPKPALRLLDEALRIAAPRTLGFRGGSGETLDSLFRRSRQLLRAQNKDLVLLFEDLVQFGLIDGELYDQFITQPGDDMAPLRVVFAITDGRYSDLAETVRTRITHRFTVKPLAPADSGEFLARYLNLVRVGRADVEAEWNQALDGKRDWLRNACDTREDGNPCRFRDRCHAGFGTVEVPGLGDVGLYPYNEVALRRALNQPGKSPTPRRALDVYVTEQLIEADAHLADCSYPHERLQERFDFSVQQAKETVLGGRTGTDADRLYRAQVLWGDEESLPPVIAEAFSLKAPATAKPARPDPVEPKRKQPAEPAAKPTKPERPSPLTQLLQWQNGTDELPASEVDEYRSTLLKMVTDRLGLDQDLFHTAGSGAGSALLNGFLSRYSFVIKGARGRAPAAGNVRFDLTRAPEDVRVLIAAKWFRDHGHWDPDEATWPWPKGYKPEDLMLTLEYRLDQWADEVRRRFMHAVGGRAVARAAVGLRAVTLLALGASPGELKTLNDVLDTKPRQTELTDTWAGVDPIARQVWHDCPPVDLVAQYAAVRQGDGGPQLIDAVGLALDLREILEQPVTYLRKIEQDMAQGGADLAVGARNLATAVEKVAETFLSDLVEATTYLRTTLDGRPANAVARTARDIGAVALEHGLFRPADSFLEFKEATAALETLPRTLPLDWRADGNRPAADQALAVQGWAGAAIRGAQDLAVIRRSMEATYEWCARNDVTAADLQERKEAVRASLVEIRRSLDVLGSAEDNRG